MTAKKYQAKKIDRPLFLDGSGSDPLWKDMAWTDDFIDIRSENFPTPKYRTRVKMCWSDQYFYVFAKLEEADVWATLTEKNSIIFNDNDFEVFIDPDSDGLNYYEFEINALGTIWELTLDKSYHIGGKATHGTNLTGLIAKVHIEGEINNPQMKDKGWSVEIAFPWSELKKYHAEGNSPPQVGDRWKINFSRVQWKHEVIDGKYVRIPPHDQAIPYGEHPEDNWVWSPMGEIAMHHPERWGMVEFIYSSSLQA